MSSGLLVFWSSGLLVFWSSGLLVFWSSGLLVFWSSGLLVFWSSGAVWDAPGAWTTWSRQDRAELPGSAALSSFSTSMAPRELSRFCRFKN
jgi:hypothetical protein